MQKTINDKIVYIFAVWFIEFRVLKYHVYEDNIYDNMVYLR